MQTRFHALVLGVLSLAILAPASPPSAPVARGPLGKSIDDYLTRLAGVGFSGVVLVAKDGEVALEKAYGLADRGKNRPLTIDTPLLVGSITKQFTAAAIMKLEMAGKLKVTDAIDKYFPNAPADKKGITLHQLLTHSAGLESDYGSGDAEQVPRDEFVRRVFAKPLRTPPGAEYNYSNAGYSLLGMIVESLSGRSWEEFLHDELFVPAGMTRTGAKLSRFDIEALPHGYVNGEDRGRFIEDYGPDGPWWNQRANGGVFSTVGDMFRWHLALQGDKILSAEAKKKMFSPYVREGPDAATFYGYGWVVGKTPRGTTLIEHNGGNGVFSADFRRFVDEGVVIYLACNGADLSAWQVSPALIRIAFGGEPPKVPAVGSISPTEVQQLAGRYTLPSGGELVIEVKEGARLYLAGAGQGAVEVVQPEARAQRARLDALNVRVQEIATEGGKGNDGPLQKALDTHPPLAQLHARQQAMRDEDVRQYGPLKGVTVLGTMVGPEERAFTLVRRDFERGSVHERFAWERNELVGIRRVSAPGGVPLFPTPDGGLVSYSIRTGSETRVTVERGADGRVTALVVAGTPAVKATRAS